MRQFNFFFIFSGIVLFASCKNSAGPGALDQPDSVLFPAQLVQFKEYVHNPVFTGTGTATWDELIRERGYILKEDDGYHLWYTGHTNNDDTLALGYASSRDGVAWTRYPGNPVFRGSWTEDMMVIKDKDIYYMLAEGRGDTAHMLTSRDKINWEDQGQLRIFYKDGKPLSAGAYGTPTVIKEDSTWYLFYERHDSAVWLASSTDLNRWTNVQDEPVLKKGPGAYDAYGVAMNQVTMYNNLYYGYYHGTNKRDWSDWNTNVAVSADLRNWKKFGGNPILQQNKSSGILVHDGAGFRLYTMHPQVNLHFSGKR